MNHVFKEKIRIWTSENKSAATAVKLMAILVFSFVFMLLFSLWTSPFYKNWYGCDAAFFTMAGRGIVEKGWVPYKDFFDLKGPYFFFLQALSQFICKGRTGAYITQSFALFFSIVLMSKCAKLFISSKKSAFIVLIYLLFFISTLWGGNTLEEYALPLNLLSIYLVLKDLKKADFNGEIGATASLITGISFGIILFAKVTVASPIVGLVLAVVIFFIRNKRYQSAVIFLLYAFLGVLLAMTPVFIYFYLHSALSEMLYSVFIFAFKRSTDFGTPFNIRWELKISGCYFAIIFVLCQLKIKKSSVKSANKAELSSKAPNRLCRQFMLTLVFFAAFVTAITLHFGDPFIYYFTTVYPILMLTFITMFLIYDPFILFRKWRLDIPAIAFLITLCYFSSHVATQLNTVIFGRDNTYYQEYVDAAGEMASLIPSGERDSVYSLNMDMQWFECNNLLPCYSYTINLQFFVALDNRIEQNILDKIKNDPPKWIVCGDDIVSYIPSIGNEILSNYTNIYSNQYGSLYLLD